MVRPSFALSLKCFRLPVITTKLPGLTMSMFLDFPTSPGQRPLHAGSRDQGTTHALSQSVSSQVKVGLAV